MSINYYTIHNLERSQKLCFLTKTAVLSETMDFIKKIADFIKNHGFNKKSETAISVHSEPTVSEDSETVASVDSETIVFADSKTVISVDFKIAVFVDFETVISTVSGLNPLGSFCWVPFIS